MALHRYLRMELICLVQLQQLYPQVKDGGKKNNGIFNVKWFPFQTN